MMTETPKPEDAEVIDDPSYDETEEDWDDEENEDEDEDEE